MIDINTALQNILKAIYGKDVRQSIHDAIYQINQNANEAIDLAQIKFGTDITDPTSPVGDYIEGTVYFHVETGIIWKLSGGSWSQLGTMKTINTIEKTSTSGLVDTYTISYNDGTTKDYTVTNGEKGTSVVNITKVSTTGNVDHYDVNLSDGTRTPNGFDVANGISITDISLESTVGNVKNYNVKLSDGSKTPTGFSIADGVSSYVYIRYSANFDGSGMVTVPSDQTVYIGICVTTQSTAPTDPAVYSWVRFIGKSGTGSGDMLASDYATLYANTVDRAAALYDGNKEISADQLMDKSTYADADLTETVKKATTLVDKVNSKEADTEVLAKFSESAEGKLLYDNKPIEPDIDNETIVRNEAGEMTLGSDVTTKLQKIDDDGEITNKVQNLDSNGKIDASNVKVGNSDVSEELQNAKRYKSGDIVDLSGVTFTFGGRLGWSRTKAVLSLPFDKIITKNPTIATTANITIYIPSGAINLDKSAVTFDNIQFRNNILAFRMSFPSQTWPDGKQTDIMCSVETQLKFTF